MAIRAVDDTIDTGIRSVDDAADNSGPIRTVDATPSAASDLNNNEFERTLRAEQERKQAAITQAQAQAQAAAQQQAQQAADPKNWTLEQAKDHFKQNPPKNPGEEAAMNALLDQKKVQIRSIQDQIEGKQSTGAQEEFRNPAPKNIFSQIGDKINKALGDAGIIESPEYKIAKSQNAYAIAKAHGLNPADVEKNYEAYALNPKYTGIMPGFGAEVPAEGGGPLRNTEAVLNKIITPAVVAGIVTNPATVLPTLGVFMGIHTVGDMAGIGKGIEDSKLTPEAKAGVRLIRMFAEGAASGAGGVPAGKAIETKFPQFKQYSDFWHGILGKTPPAAAAAEGVQPAPEAVQKTAENPVGSTQPDLNQPPAVYKAPAVDHPAMVDRVNQELIPANEGRTLTPEEQHAQNFTTGNPQAVVDNYLARIHDEYKTSHDNVVSADSAKYAIPGMKVENSGNYHEAASAFSKFWFEHLLKDPATKDKDVLFTAGVSGAGKTHNTRALLSAKEQDYGDFAAVYDTNLNSLSTFENKMAAIEKSNEELGGSRGVIISLTHRDPVEAWVSGVLPRAAKQGRIVPIDAHIKNALAPQAIAQIAEKYPDVEVHVLENKGNNVSQIPLDKALPMEYTYKELRDKLVSATEQAYADGKISKAAYETAIGPQGTAEAAVAGGGQGDSVQSPQDAAIRTQPDGANPAGAVEEPAAPSEKTRKFITTVRESPNTVPEVANVVDSKYTPISNKETLIKAQDFVKNNYDEAVNLVEGSARATTEHNAVAQVLIDKAQQEGRFADAVRLVERTAEKQTELGQAIQSLSMYNRLTPEGILMTAQRAVNKAKDNIKQRAKVNYFDRVAKDLNEQDKDKLAKKLGIPHISEVVAGELRRMAEQIKDMPEGRDKEIETALMLKKISDQIPHSLGEKISMLQTMAQLLNPKTMVRNFLGNVGFMAMENIADVFATGLDVAASLRTGKRTVYLPNPLEQAKGFVQGGKEGTQEALLGVNLKGTQGKFTLPKSGVFDTGVLGALEKTLRLSLGVPDRAFYQAAFNQSLREQTRAAALDEPTDAMVERAHLIGMYRTFQDDNVLSNQFSKIKQWFNNWTVNVPGLEGKFGLGDLVIKYPKTPANILARGIEYSPFGFAKMIFAAARPAADGSFDQEAFVRSGARAFTGSTLLIGTGAILGAMGIISGKRSKDKDVSATREGVGIREYQVNIDALKRFAMSGLDPDQAKIQPGDRLVTYDWALPSSIGLALGANMVIDPKSSKVDKVLNFADAFAQASQTLQDQPLVQGIKTFTSKENLGEAVTNIIKDMPASFVPTLLNQVKQLTDNVSRNTKDPNYFKEVYNRAAQRVPGLSKTLPARVTPLGEDKQAYQLGSNNPFNVFLNPSFVTKYNPDPVSKMVLDIWENSGQTVQFPRVAQTKIKLGTPEPVELTPSQYTAFQKYIGNKTDVLFNLLASKPGFMALDDETKAKSLQTFLTDINTAAKIEVLGYRPKRLSKDVATIMHSIARDKHQIEQNIRVSDEGDIRAVEDTNP